MFVITRTSFKLSLTSYLYFHKLRETYATSRKRKRPSQLQYDLTNIAKHEQRARELLLKASKVKIYTAMGLVRLRASCLEKEKILTEALSEIAILGTTILVAKGY